MKNLFLLFICIVANTNLFAQSNFSTEAYQNFIESNKDLSYSELLEMHPLKNEYFKGIDNGSSIYNYPYLDSLIEKYDLTTDELSLLEQNHFMVSERLSRRDFGNSLAEIYYDDMPVFISSDAILHAVHMSYDAILYELEYSLLQENIKVLSKKLYENMSIIIEKYQNQNELKDNIEDIDLYVTIAYSLISNKLYDPHIISKDKVEELWNAINAEEYVQLSLFSSGVRDIDFSQFTVRGHYTEGLSEYFKTMMWYGRMEFLFTKTSLMLLTDDDLKRMSIDAYLLNECMEMVNGFDIIEINETIIEYFVGESDNLKPLELKEVLLSLNIKNASSLLNTDTLDILVNTLEADSKFQQNILGNIIMTNPYGSEPTPLPLSYKLMGQRFILDSYILSNLVYDRIIFEDEKIWRPMPDPLDAMFVLGNENTLPLLKDELESYKYSSNLASLKYLVDSYDAEFWSNSYYNGWLNSISKLNAPNNLDGYPLFCKSAAWQHEKMNTQLASWSQLRHDNLLYAKPSYTGGITCEYPHAYIEPYPDFYKALGTISHDMSVFFESLKDDSDIAEKCESYFKSFAGVMDTLESIANKEITATPFSDNEIFFLKSVIFHGGGGCRKTQDGWYPKLYYLYENEFEADYIIADIHTQPTDEAGDMVGNVMHVGTGMINLGVFLAKCPSNEFKKMAFIGPVMSYYEKYTTDFERRTDEEWEEIVGNDMVPERPDWVNIYLADKYGNTRAKGRELPSTVYTQVGINHKISKTKVNASIRPNPASNSFNLVVNADFNDEVNIFIYDNTGKCIKQSNSINITKGESTIPYSINDLNNGIYYCIVKGNRINTATKLIKQ